MKWLAIWMFIPATAASAAEQVRTYIANDDHTDYVWTADADTYTNVFVDQLDFHLRLIGETASNPSDFRDRFNCDGSEWLWAYETKKGPAAFDHLMKYVKEGEITSPLNTLVSCYGAQPAEAVLRGLYYAGRLERRYDTRFALALAMENQTLPLGLASLFAGAGAKYSWRGVCGCATRIPATQLANRSHEIYWYTGHDGQRLLLKWYSARKNWLGYYSEASNPESAITATEKNSTWLSMYVDPVTHKTYDAFGIFGFGGDDLERKAGVTPPPAVAGVPGLQKIVSSPYCPPFTDIARKMSDPIRQVIVSNEVDFFRDFETNYGKTLPAQCVTFGNEWDLYSASMSETSAAVKRSVEKLRSAELLATLVSLKYPDFTRRFVGDRDRAFRSLGMYWEHDWTADGPISRGQRAAWEQLQAETIACYVDSIYAEGIVRLGGMIPRPAKANRFYVMNPLGWNRTGAADVRYSGSHLIHVRDVTTGRDVPFQSINVDGASMLRIWATDIPSAGYKVFEILPGESDASHDMAAVARGDVLENEAVQISVDRDGAIRSLIDKRNGNAELVQEIAGLRLNDINANSDDGDPLKVENAGPVSVTLRARSDGGLPHSTSITLYRDSSRVDIRNEITANFSDVRYWSFGTSINKPIVHTEEIGAINLNELRKDGGDYADENARYDHITVNHFADITASDGRTGLTISNADCSFARLGASSAGSLDTATPQINMLAGGQVDGSSLGIRDQNGATHFLQRFALVAHKDYDPVFAMKNALEHQNPLVCGPVIGLETGAYPADSYSLLKVSDPNIQLWAVKPAEEGIDQGVIVRLWNVSDAHARSTITPAFPIVAARRTTHVETNIGEIDMLNGGIVVDCLPQQIQTYRLSLAADSSTQPATVSSTRP